MRINPCIFDRMRIFATHTTSSKTHINGVNEIVSKKKNKNKTRNFIINFGDNKNMNNVYVKCNSTKKIENKNLKTRRQCRRSSKEMQHSNAEQIVAVAGGTNYECRLLATPRFVQTHL